MLWLCVCNSIKSLLTYLLRLTYLLNSISISSCFEILRPSVFGSQIGVYRNRSMRRDDSECSYQTPSWRQKHRQRILWSPNGETFVSHVSGNSVFWVYHALLRIAGIPIRDCSGFSMAMTRSWNSVVDGRSGGKTGPVNMNASSLLMWLDWVSSNGSLPMTCIDNHKL